MKPIRPTSNDYARAMKLRFKLGLAKAIDAAAAEDDVTVSAILKCHARQGGYTLKGNSE